MPIYFSLFLSSFLYYHLLQKILYCSYVSDVLYCIFVFPLSIYYIYIFLHGGMLCTIRLVGGGIDAVAV